VNVNDAAWCWGQNFYGEGATAPRPCGSSRSRSRARWRSRSGARGRIGPAKPPRRASDTAGDTTCMVSSATTPSSIAACDADRGADV